jgi:hypothetical protein
VRRYRPGRNQGVVIAPSCDLGRAWGHRYHVMIVALQRSDALHERMRGVEGAKRTDILSKTVGAICVGRITTGEPSTSYVKVLARTIIKAKSELDDYAPAIYVIRQVIADCSMIKELGLTKRHNNVVLLEERQAGGGG